MMSEIDTVSTTNEMKVTETLTLIKEKEGIIQNLIDQMDGIQRYTSNFQFFIGIKEVEIIIVDSKRVLHDLSEQGALNDIFIAMEENEEMERTLSCLISFGNITVTANVKDLVDTSDLQIAQKSKIPLTSVIFFKT